MSARGARRQRGVRYGQGALLDRHCRTVASLRKQEVLRSVLDGLTVRLDGTPAAPSVICRRRKILNTAVEYAVERRMLPANPVPALKWKAPRTVHAVDRRSVANPGQVRSLLEAVREQKRSGARLVTFFGCLYFSAMRPEEAAVLNKSNLSLPAEGWGRIHLVGAEPHAGKDWTDSGKNRDKRQLKQREIGEGRDVPCPPELTSLLHWHMDTFGSAPDGRLFTGERNGDELPKGTINKAWRLARLATFTPEVAASPLAASPTTYGTPQCRRGSTGECRQPMSLPGRGTPWRSCSRSTRSAWTLERTCSGSAFRRR